MHLRAFVLVALLALLCLTPASAQKQKHRRHQTVELEADEPDRMPTRMPNERSLAPSLRPNVGHHSIPVHINGRYREGIDVSHYQGNIDWDAVVKNANISYVYIKATEGSNFVDNTYVYNLSEARRVGLSVGSYHFYRPAISPTEQLENMKRNIPRDEQDLVPMIDIESRGSVSDDRFVKDLADFCRMVERYYGRKPLLYTYQNFYNRHLVGQLRGYHWMMAKYTDDPPKLTDNVDYMMWQYTAKGQIGGIRGSVDRSRLIGRHQLKQVQM